MSTQLTSLVPAPVPGAGAVAAYVVTGVETDLGTFCAAHIAALMALLKLENYTPMPNPVGADIPLCPGDGFMVVITAPLSASRDIAQAAIRTGGHTVIHTESILGKLSATSAMPDHAATAVMFAFANPRRQTANTASNI